MPAAVLTSQPTSAPAAAAVRQVARERAGLSITDAAAKARVEPSYLRAIEREQRTASFGLAQRLASIYSCRFDLFISTRHTAAKSANQPKKGSARR